MLDLAFVRDHQDLVKEKLRQRGMNPEVVLGDFHAIDLQRRAILKKLDIQRVNRSFQSEEISRFKRLEREGKLSPQDAAQLALLTNTLGQSKGEAAQLEKTLEDFNIKLREILVGIPNLPDDSVPVGKSEADNVEVRRWGTSPQFDFVPKPHWELGEELGVLDLERAAKLTGARFAVYWDLGAKLERALMNFMLDLHTREHGYTEVLPPFMVNAESLYGTGNLPKFEADLFKVPLLKFEPDPNWIPRFGELVRNAKEDHLFRITKVDHNSRSVEYMRADGLGTPVWSVPWNSLLRQRDFYLIPTAEVPVTNLYRDETLDGARLPISLTAYTPCFRSEAGSYGKDVRGIIRQHQFQKVELVKFTKPEQSREEHEKLTHDAEEVLQKLGLHYRVMVLSTGDMGWSSAKTYDIEVWLPGQQLFREISSCSNFTDYQARRANIRYRPEGGKKTELVHTINGSGLAIGRTWVAIVENYQQADGSVVIPEVLRPYIGAERITAKKF